MILQQSGAPYINYFFSNTSCKWRAVCHNSAMPTKTRHGQQGIDQQPTRTVQQPLKTAGVCEGHSNQRRCWVSQRVGISGICSNQACKRWMYRNSGLNSCWHIKRAGPSFPARAKKGSPRRGEKSIGALETRPKPKRHGLTLWFFNRRKNGREYSLPRSQCRPGR